MNNAQSDGPESADTDSGSAEAEWEKPAFPVVGIGGVGGTPEALGTNIQNVNEHRRAERELELFKFICDQSHDPFYLVNQEGRFHYANHSAYSWLGYTEAELMAKGLADVDHILGGLGFRELFHKAQTGDIRPFESEHIGKGGNSLPVECSVTGLNFEGEVFLLAVVRDISERKRSEDALRQSEAKLRQSQKVEAVGKLAGGIAHDFNNLLTAINGYGDICLSSVEEDNPLYDNLLEIRKAGERAASLTRKLLAYSRKQVQSPQPLSLNAVVLDIHKMLIRLVGEHIELARNLEESLGLVMADPGEIEQMLLNLVLNARDAMPDGGTITISTRVTELDEAYAATNPLVIPGSYTVLEVADTGIGMDVQLQARIFDPFFTTKGIGKGSGLGLPMVHGIVAQSGGHVTVKSEPGKGAVFTIFLPRLGDGEVGFGRGYAKIDPAFSGKETVLLAEDENTVRTFTRKILEMHGYTVLDAPDGDSALAKAALHPTSIQLLLTDVIMPGMSGRGLAERFHQRYPTGRVLFMSGYTDEIITRKELTEKSAAYLQKPFTPSQLVKAMREVLDGTPIGR